MIKLEETITELHGVGIPGLTAKCIERTDKKAIYKRSDNVWEVFRVKISPPTKIFNREYPEREVYPGNEDFGSTAWCFNSLERAMEWYMSL